MRHRLDTSFIVEWKLKECVSIDKSRSNSRGRLFPWRGDITTNRRGSSSDSVCNVRALLDDHQKQPTATRNHQSVHINPLQETRRTGPGPAVYLSWHENTSANIFQQHFRHIKRNNFVSQSDWLGGDNETRLSMTTGTFWKKNYRSEFLIW